jgi:hypothetical protein
MPAAAGTARPHVGRDHAFLDQLVRIVALQHAGLGDLARVVQHEAHFAALELDRAALLRAPCPAPCTAGAGARICGSSRRSSPARGVVASGIALAHRVPHLGVGQARVRMHHRLVELRPVTIALAADLHVADEAQAVDLRIQRADAVGQASPAASAPRSRGNTPRSRASALHRPAACPAARSARHRRWPTIRRKPSLFGSHHTASSKSLASSPSMVTSGTSRRSTRPAMSPAAPAAAPRSPRQHLGREFVRHVVAVDRGLHHLRGSELVAQHREDLADRRAMRIRRLVISHTTSWPLRASLRPSAGSSRCAGRACRPAPRSRCRPLRCSGRSGG